MALRQVARSVLQAPWAPVASEKMLDLTRQMGTERRPGLSGAWKQGA